MGGAPPAGGAPTFVLAAMVDAADATAQARHEESLRRQVPSGAVASTVASRSDSTRSSSARVSATTWRARCRLTTPARSPSRRTRCRRGARASSRRRDTSTTPTPVAQAISCVTTCSADSGTGDRDVSLASCCASTVCSAAYASTRPASSLALDRSSRSICARIRSADLSSDSSRRPAALPRVETTTAEGRVPPARPFGAAGPDPPPARPLRSLATRSRGVGGTSRNGIATPPRCVVTYL